MKEIKYYFRVDATTGIYCTIPPVMNGTVCVSFDPKNFLLNVMQVP